MPKKILLLLLFSTMSAAQVDTARQYPIDTNHSTVGFVVSMSS